VVTHKLVGWDLQKPRDNRMYHVGEGEANLSKLDKHIRKKKGSSHVFSNEIINDNYLKKMRRKRVKAAPDSISRFKKSMQNSQRSDDLGGPNASHTTADTAFNTRFQFHSNAAPG